jgi:hypothetical protein
VTTVPDLKQQLQSLADRRTAESAGDFDTVLTTAVARRRRRTALWSAAATVLAVGGVALFTPWLQHESEPAPAATQPPAPVEMAIVPAAARPNETLTVTFSGATPRGIAYQLEMDPGNVLYYLISNRGAGPGVPTWFTPDDEGLGWDDIGIEDAGPDRLVLPETVQEGVYRLCTANAAVQICAPLTIRR